MKKIITYLLIIVIAVAIIGGVYWLMTCPLSKEALPTLEEKRQRATEAAEKGEYYTPPYDPNMVVEDESNNNMPVVVNQVEVMLNEGENKETADELAVKVNGTVVGVMPLNMYVIELQTSTINELEDAIEIIEADPRVKVATMSGFFEMY